MHMMHHTQGGLVALTLHPASVARGCVSVVTFRQQVIMERVSMSLAAGLSAFERAWPLLTLNHSATALSMLLRHAFHAGNGSFA